METFREEQTFANFDDFEQHVQIYQQATGYTLSTFDSKISKPVHKFYYDFKALHCKKSGVFKPKGKGIRKKESKKTKCPFILRIKVSSDLSHLKISKLNLIHNHAPNDDDEIDYVDDGTPLWTDPEMQMQVDEDLVESGESEKVIEDASSLEQSFKELSTVVDDSDLEQDLQVEEHKIFAPEETNNEVPLKKRKWASRGQTKKESSLTVDNINSVTDFEIKEQRISAIKKKEIILPFEEEKKKGKVRSKKELSTLVDNSIEVKENIAPEKKNTAPEKKNIVPGKKNIIPGKKNIAPEKKNIAPEKKHIAVPLEEKKKGRGRPKKELATLVDNSIDDKELKTIAPEKINVAVPLDEKKRGRGRPKKELSTLVDNSIQDKELKTTAPEKINVAVPLDEKKRGRGRPKKSATTTAIGMNITKVELKAFVDCSEKSQLYKISCWLGVSAEITNKIVTGEYVVQSTFLEPLLINLVDPLLSTDIDFNKYSKFFDKKALNYLISAQCNQRKTRLFKCQQCSLNVDKEKILCASCLWRYHPKCVRVSLKNVKDIEKYFCKLCKKK